MILGPWEQRAAAVELLGAEAPGVTAHTAARAEAAANAEIDRRALQEWAHRSVDIEQIGFPAWALGDASS